MKNVTVASRIQGLLLAGLVSAIFLNACGPRPPGGTKSVVTKRGSCSMDADCAWPATPSDNKAYNACLSTPKCFSGRCRADLKSGYQCLEGRTHPCPDGVGEQTCTNTGTWTGCN